MSKTTALKEQSNSILELIHNENYSLEIISEKERQKYEKNLKENYNCDFKDDLWEIKETFQENPSKINFNRLDFLLPEELNVVKCFVVDKLAVKFERISSINNHIFELKKFFTYLHKEKVKLKDFNAVCYTLYLKENPESKINPFIEFLNLQNIVNVAVQKHSRQKGQKRSAIEQSVIEQLDVYFFNIENKHEIPTDMRAIYLSLRFICNRISEVLNMKTDCIKDIDENLFSICIPNTKSTSRHTEKYVNYPFSTHGNAELIFRNAIESQIKYSLSHNDRRLFISCSNPQKTVKAQDFNNYIAAICEKEGICNADGSIAVPTSHQFRHNDLTERIDSNIFPRKLLQKEMNHTNIDSQLTYYGKSSYDKLIEDKKIVDSVYTKDSVETIFDGRNQNIENIKIVPKFQYNKLLNNPRIRFLPNNLLCSTCNCQARFESCLSCDNFVPDPSYYEDVKQLVNQLEEKLLLIKKAGQSPVEKNIKNQIKIYKLYLRKVGTVNEKEKYRR